MKKKPEEREAEQQTKRVGDEERGEEKRPRTTANARGKHQRETEIGAVARITTSMFVRAEKLDIETQNQ